MNKNHFSIPMKLLVIFILKCQTKLMLHVSEVSSCLSEVQEKGYQLSDRVFQGMYVCVCVCIYMYIHEVWMGN